MTTPSPDMISAAPATARSAIAVAFSYEENVVGVIHLWDERVNHFDELAAAFLETLASKASLSYGNNLRYLENQERSERLARRVEQLNQIFELGQMLQSNVDPVTMLEAICLQRPAEHRLRHRDHPHAGSRRRACCGGRLRQGLPLDAFEESQISRSCDETCNKLFEKTNSV